MSEEKQVKKNFIKIISYLMNKTFLQMIKQHHDVCSKKNKGINRKVAACASLKQNVKLYLKEFFWEGIIRK